MTPQEYFPHYYPHFRLRWLTARNLLLGDGITEAERPDPTLRLLPAHHVTVPYILVKPDSLQRNDIYQAEDGSRWRVLARCADNSAPVVNGFPQGAPQHVYLMERMTGGERGEVKVKALTAIWNVKLAGGTRYGHAITRPDPRMAYIGYDTFCAYWRELEAAS